MNSESTVAPPRKRRIWGGRRQWVRLLVACCVLMLILLAIAPWLLAKTGLRNQLFAALVNDPNVRVSSKDASFGYFSPLSISGLDVNANDGQAIVQIRQIEAQKSWLSMLFERPQLGSFTFSQPRFDVIVGKSSARPGEPIQLFEADQSAKPAATGELPELTAVIEDASVVVREADSEIPAIDLQAVNVTFRMQRGDDGSVLTIDPVKVFDHQVLTPEICNKGLHLVAPLMAEQIDADGAFSFQLDVCRIPVGVQDEALASKKIQVAGMVQLHHANVGLRDSIASEICELIGDLIGADVSDRFRVVEETEVSFHVADGRVYHEGFAMMLPHRDASIELRTAGSVGLDNTVDIQVEIGLPSGLLGDSELIKAICEKPIGLLVTGTLDEPVVKLDPTRWTERVQKLLDSDAIGEGQLIERTADLLREISKNRPEREERLLPSLRDRWRARREKRRNKDDDQDK